MTFRIANRTAATIQTASQWVHRQLTRQAGHSYVLHVHSCTAPSHRNSETTRALKAEVEVYWFALALNAHTAAINLQFDDAIRHPGDIHDRHTALYCPRPTQRITYTHLSQVCRRISSVICLSPAGRMAVLSGRPNRPWMRACISSEHHSLASFMLCACVVSHDVSANASSRILAESVDVFALNSICLRFECCTEFVLPWAHVYEKYDADRLVYYRTEGEACQVHH